VFEKRVMRILFGPQEEEVMGGWRRLHDEELRYFTIILLYTEYHYSHEIKDNYMG
jgi:hypothetical protein